MRFPPGAGIQTVDGSFSTAHILAYPAVGRFARGCGGHLAGSLYPYLPPSSPVQEESSLGTWIYRIATNECLRFLNMRKEQAVSAEEVQEELMNKLMASDYVDYENEMAVKFQQAILMLPEKQRIVFNLRYYDELEYEEISRITDTK